MTSSDDFVTVTDAELVRARAAIKSGIRGAALSPGVDAPEFRASTTGGTILSSMPVGAGFLLAMNRPGAVGTIYWTTDDALYQSERWGLSSYRFTVPNGTYTVRMHFAETYEGITGPGERVFSFNVQGKDFKDFDPWVKAGVFLKAYIETVPVEVTDGKVKVTFTPKVENPQICAIEIIPQSGTETSAAMPAPATTTFSAPDDTGPAPTAPTGPTVLQIDAGKVTGKVSPMLYGLMTEEINFAYEGGIYAELIRNRSFKADAVVPRVTPETYEVGNYLPVTFRSDSGRPGKDAHCVPLRL